MFARVKDKASVSALGSHFSDVLASPTATPAQAVASMREQVTELAGQGRLGVLFSERLVNMPVQIMPHMLRQVGEEIAHAQSKVRTYSLPLELG